MKLEVELDELDQLEKRLELLEKKLEDIRILISDQEEEKTIRNEIDKVQAQISETKEQIAEEKKVQEKNTSEKPKMKAKTNVKTDTYIGALERPKILCTIVAIAMTVSFLGKAIFQKENGLQEKLGISLHEASDINKELFISWGRMYFDDGKISAKEFEEIYEYIQYRKDEIEEMILQKAYAGGLVKKANGESASRRIEERQEYENIELKVDSDHNKIIINYVGDGKSDELDFEKLSEEEIELLKEYEIWQSVTDFRNQMPIISDEQKVEEYIEEIKKVLKEMQLQGLLFGDVKPV